MWPLATSSLPCKRISLDTPNDLAHRSLPTTTQSCQLVSFYYGILRDDTQESGRYDDHDLPAVHFETELHYPAGKC